MIMMTMNPLKTSPCLKIFKGNVRNARSRSEEGEESIKIAHAARTPTVKTTREKRRVRLLVNTDKGW